MSKQILTNNAGDSLQPNSKPAQDQADSRQYANMPNPMGPIDDARYSKGWSGPDSPLNSLTKHMLSQMDQRPPTGAERTGQNSGIALDTFDRSKREAGAQSSERLDALKGAAGGRDYGSTQRNLDEPDRNYPKWPAGSQRQAY